MWAAKERTKGRSWDDGQGATWHPAGKPTMRQVAPGPLVRTQSLDMERSHGPPATETEPFDLAHFRRRLAAVRKGGGLNAGSPLRPRGQLPANGARDWRTEEAMDKEGREREREKGFGLKTHRLRNVSYDSHTPSLEKAGGAQQGGPFRGPVKGEQEKSKVGAMQKHAQQPNPTTEHPSPRLRRETSRFVVLFARSWEAKVESASSKN